MARQMTSRPAGCDDSLEHGAGGGTSNSTASVLLPLESEHRCPYCEEERVFTTATALVKHVQFDHKPRESSTEDTHACEPCEVGAPQLDGVASGAASSWEAQVLHRLAHARVINHTPRETVQDLKHSLREASLQMKRLVEEKIAPHLPPGVSAHELIAEVFKAADTIMPRDAELEDLRTSRAYVKPVQRPLGVVRGGGANEVVEEFFAYDAPLEETLEKMFSTDSESWEDVRTFPERISRHLRSQDAFADNIVITDITHGSEFGQFMLRLQIKGSDIPLVFMFYYDGLEVVNGLGQARTTHELACFYWALVNVRQQHRMHPARVRLASVCYKRALASDKVGFDAVLNKGYSSWGESMARLATGITLATPDGPRCFRGGMAIVVADTPAAAELAGTKKAVGPTTKSICRGCLELNRTEL